MRVGARGAPESRLRCGGRSPLRPGLRVATAVRAPVRVTGEAGGWALCGGDCGVRAAGCGARCPRGAERGRPPLQQGGDAEPRCPPRCRPVLLDGCGELSLSPAPHRYQFPVSRLFYCPRSKLPR